MTDWQDRIIETRSGDPAELVTMLHPDNPKSHPEEQMEGLEHSLNKVGWIDRPIWNKRTNYFLDGNGRVKLALMAGQSSIKYDVVDLSPEEERYVLATFDALVGMAETDAVKLLALVNEVGEDLPEAVSDHLLGMIGEVEEPSGNGLGGDVPPAVDKAEELREKWGVRVNQVWQLGRHRLICGDCTDRDVVERLIEDQPAQFCFTDPPYNVGVAYGDATNDSRTRADFIEWCSKWTCFLPSKNCMTVGIKRLLWWDEILGDPAWIIAWIKRNGQGQTGLGGTNKWDAILCYGIEPDHDIDVIEINNDYSENIKASGSHPTAKPTALWSEIINRFSKKEDIIYEPFLGTGTALLASENLNRQCRSIEIEPAYSAISIERWHQLTGQEPVLLEDTQ